MTWLLKMFPGTWWIYAAVLAAAFAAGGTAAWQFQGARLDKVQAEYDGFVGMTRILGEAAAKAATEQAARDLKAKQGADRENQTTLDTLRADIKRLRDQRAGSSIVPAAAAGASRPDLACFDRSELERAIRAFDADIQGLVDEGSAATVNLDSAKKWAQR